MALPAQATRNKQLRDAVIHHDPNTDPGCITIRTLLSQGAKINEPADGLDSPALAAIRYHRPEAFHALVTSNEGVHAIDKTTGVHIMQVAIDTAHPRLIQLALQTKGFDINALDTHGCTHLANLLFYMRTFSFINEGKFGPDGEESWNSNTDLHFLIQGILLEWYFERLPALPTKIDEFPDHLRKKYAGQPKLFEEAIGIFQKFVKDTKACAFEYQGPLSALNCLLQAGADVTIQSGKKNLSPRDVLCQEVVKASAWTGMGDRPLEMGSEDFATTYISSDDTGTLISAQLKLVSVDRNRWLPVTVQIDLQPMQERVQQHLAAQEADKKKSHDKVLVQRVTALEAAHDVHETRLRRHSGEIRRISEDDIVKMSSAFTDLKKQLGVQHPLVIFMNEFVGHVDDIFTGRKSSKGGNGQYIGTVGAIGQAVSAAGDVVPVFGCFAKLVGGILQVGDAIREKAITTAIAGFTHNYHPNSLASLAIGYALLQKYGAQLLTCKLTTDTAKLAAPRLALLVISLIAGGKVEHTDDRPSYAHIIDLLEAEKLPAALKAIVETPASTAAVAAKAAAFHPHYDSKAKACDSKGTAKDRKEGKDEKKAKAKEAAVSAAPQQKSRLARLFGGGSKPTPVVGVSG